MEPVGEMQVWVVALLCRLRFGTFGQSQPPPVQAWSTSYAFCVDTEVLGSKTTTADSRQVM